MVVKDRIGNRGQSILEFILLLPLLIGLTTILIRINTAIQISIVDQQYARQHALYLTFNSAFYPEVRNQQSLIHASSNQMILGVSEQAASEGYTPKPTSQNISQHKRAQRSLVKIRSTVTLCTQQLLVGSSTPILKLGPGPLYAASGRVALDEKTRFNNFCFSPMQYETGQDEQ